ncbi:hypothetical protein WS70_24045 [Burkholderia mayonis]|uniref:Uncharacterized protein n=1 Tax=Burkholderia mayonis TaxID=1385591 RepID=A0A1B4FMF4_9BURK|nr:hypothetical protein WS70_24045 [Burkholderia mayonis]KVE45624.1 hypothetical protein WS70_04290 [Burkholderia mayonis]
MPSAYCSPTGYARAVHVAFGLSSRWRGPSRLRCVYGALLSPGARRIAALTFERGRRIGGGHGDVVSAMLGHDSASAPRDASDDEIACVVLDDANALSPGLADAVTAVRVRRWEAAEPLSRVGRARSPRTARARTRADACCSRAITWARRGPTVRRRRGCGRREGARPANVCFPMAACAAACGVVLRRLSLVPTHARWAPVFLVSLADVRAMRARRRGAFTRGRPRTFDTPSLT